MTPLVYTKTNKGELIMPIYNLHNFKFEEIQKDKEFSCMKYLGHDTIKTIVENITEYFSMFISSPLFHQNINIFIQFHSFFQIRTCLAYPHNSVYTHFTPIQTPCKEKFSTLFNRVLITYV